MPGYLIEIKRENRFWWKWKISANPQVNDEEEGWRGGYRAAPIQHVLSHSGHRLTRRWALHAANSRIKYSKDEQERQMLRANKERVTTEYIEVD